VLEESASAHAYTPASDVYGLCIVLSEIVTANLPFGNTPDLITQSAWLALLQGGLRPTLPALPSTLRRQIELGWSTDPAERPSAGGLLAVLEEFV
ncbi:hypothetical protein B484DRAFT_403649, partial [Ochromonadaceae sp. CCMP2298]